MASIPNNPVQIHLAEHYRSWELIFRFSCWNRTEHVLYNPWRSNTGHNNAPPTNKQISISPKHVYLSQIYSSPYTPANRITYITPTSFRYNHHRFMRYLDDKRARTIDVGICITIEIHINMCNWFGMRALTHGSTTELITPNWWKRMNTEFARATFHECII